MAPYQILETWSPSPPSPPTPDAGPSSASSPPATDDFVAASSSDMMPAHDAETGERCAKWSTRIAGEHCACSDLATTVGHERGLNLDGNLLTVTNAALLNISVRSPLCGRNPSRACFFAAMRHT